MKSYAIVPAAGLSIRMGRPKLLMPWRGSTMIEHTLSTWKQSRISELAVVVRADDQPLAVVCQNAGVQVVRPPAPPPEMKVSVQWGLRFVAETFSPRPDDAWLLAPADMPELSPAIINELLSQAVDGKNVSILAPVVNGRQGHPILFPWSLAAEVEKLGDNEGVNVLLKRHAVRHIEVSAIVHNPQRAFSDIDTPEEYQNLRADSES